MKDTGTAAIVNMISTNADGYGAQIVTADAGNDKYALNVEANGGSTKVAYFANGGNVGIGTTSPQYKLDVIGDIRATGSVFYGGSSGSADGSAYDKPDFVFENSYEIMSTKAVEAFIHRNKHLPWVTSAKDENEHGINMTRMGFETLEALENLQMQLIEQSTELERIIAENLEILAENRELNSRLSAIEAKLQL